jgi:hypothetical protein
MIIILGLVILVAAVVVGVAWVLGSGGAHGPGRGFSVLGYQVTGQPAADVAAAAPAPDVPAASSVPAG